ncbi:MAG: UDP-glucose 4-epimerase GalE [Pseudomonadota bacterium]
MANVLVTGGAGYIGSHTVKALGEAGHHVVTIDNLSKGFRQAILFGEFYEGDVADSSLVGDVIRKHQIDSLIHFAALTIVPESVEKPLLYYGNNTCKTRSLIETCVTHDVANVIFSSTAAVYGIPESGECDEQAMLAPINPYGMSKLMSEHMIRDTSKSCDMRHVILRYFNVAGSDPTGDIGQSTPNATLLVKVACEVALGKREKLHIFGTDYPNPDGTGVRDYIHVSDLAAAHVDALHYLQAGGQSSTLNCGYGRGLSVREIIEMVEKLHGAQLSVEESPRRAGDPPSLIAVANKVRETLNWTPRYDDIETIVKTSLAWEQNKQW